MNASALGQMKQGQQLITPPPIQNTMQQRQVLGQHQEQTHPPINRLSGQNTGMHPPIHQQPDLYQAQQEGQLAQQQMSQPPVSGQKAFSQQGPQQKQPSTEIGPPPKTGAMIAKAKSDFDQNLVNEKLNYIVGTVEGQLPILLQVEKNSKKAQEQQQAVRKMF